MRYYGLKRKRHKEDILYTYAKWYAGIHRILPGKRRRFWQALYKYEYKNKHTFRGNNNCLPSDCFLALDTIIIADLIHREDIPKLQKGIRYFLKKRKSNRFLHLHPIEGIDEICNRIEQMDSTLLSWYEKTECGFFECQNSNLKKSVEYFSISICNINSAYLALECRIHLTEQKKNELESIIRRNYHETRGYVSPTLTGKNRGTGSFENYAVTHYNDDALKADRVFEFISLIQWEFMEELSCTFPIVLHKRGIIPPRIEVYYTNIDYHTDYRSFWTSIGIEKYQGQFIDERQKVFFESALSGRYEHTQTGNRIIYIIKDDGIEIGQLESVKDEIYFCLREYAKEYFKILFLNILSKEAGKATVNYKRKLDKIKFRKNSLLDLYKMKYDYSTQIAAYNRYIRDDNWKQVLGNIGEIFHENDDSFRLVAKPRFISHSYFCNTAISGSKKISNDIKIIMAEFDEKEYILQNLSNYKNTKRSIHVNYLMLLIAAITLLFVVFPEQATKVAKVLKDIFHLLKSIIIEILKS